MLTIIVVVEVGITAGEEDTAAEEVDVIFSLLFMASDVECVI